MNLQQMKLELEQQLAAAENKRNRFDAMAQQTFNELDARRVHDTDIVNQRHQDDLAVHMEFFANLTADITREIDEICAKLGIEKKSGIVAHEVHEVHEVLDPVEEQIFNIQEMVKTKRRAGMQSKIGV